MTQRSATAITHQQTLALAAEAYNKRKSISMPTKIKLEQVQSHLSQNPTPRQKPVFQSLRAAIPLKTKNHPSPPAITVPRRHSNMTAPHLHLPNNTRALHLPPPISGVAKQRTVIQFSRVPLHPIHTPGNRRTYTSSAPKAVATQPALGPAP